VFAREHAIGEIAPGKVTKLVQFGAFVRVADGIEGLVHISELSARHIELAEQAVAVSDDVFVKIIDIDLERRRISLSLKQANEGVDPASTEFDPALYGMPTDYDETGAYRYPEGFDPATGEWKDGHDESRTKWEHDYSAAQARWEAHKVQDVRMNAEAEAFPEAPPADASSAAQASEPEAPGALAEDESLIALRDKLAGETAE
jgi:small subunit ribosomal protein S1